MKRIFCVAIVLVFTAGTATAQADKPVPANAEFEITGPVQLVGDVSLEANLAGVLLHPAEDSAFELSARDARLRLVNLPYRLVETHDGSAIGAKTVFVGEQPELVWERSWRGTAVLETPGGPESTIRILPNGGGFSHAFHDDVRLGPPMRFPTAAVDDHEALPSASMHGIESGRTAPEGVYAAVRDTNASVAGAMRIVLYGGNYQITGTSAANVTTGHILNSTVGDPLGQVGTWRYNRLVLLVDVADAEVTLAKGGGQLDLLVRRLAGSLAGQVRLHGAEGDLTTERTYSGGFGLAQAIGNLTLDASYGPTSAWALEGEASFVALDGDAVFRSRNLPRGLGQTKVAAASVVVIAAYAFISFMRRGLVWRWVEAWSIKPWFFAPLGVRIHIGNVMESGKRRSLLRLLSSLGMAPLHEIVRRGVRRIRVSESSIRYHLRRLCETGKVSLVARGNRWYVGPRQASDERDVQVALAFLCEPVPRAIAVALFEKPRLNQREITKRVNEFFDSSLSRIAVRRYLEEMTEFRDFRPATFVARGRLSGPTQVVRLLRKGREGRCVNYEARQALMRGLRLYEQQTSTRGTDRREPAVGQKAVN